MIPKATMLIAMSCWLAALAYSQSNSLTLDSCYARAEQNYPLTKQYSLIEKSKAYSIENANKGYLPLFSVNGQATYQSEVTQIPINLPNANIEPLSKDQYKLYGEVSQPITDLFVVKDNKGLVKANSEAERQKIEVEIYKLRERINNLFFGILLIDAQIQQTELVKKDLQNGIDKTNVAITNGIRLKSDSDNLKAELLKANQHLIELTSHRQGYADMLSLFIGQPINESTTFLRPQPPMVSDTINRPELKLYDLQKKSLDYQRQLITAKNLPRFSLFFQGGLGRPALNMLSNDMKGYYIGGLRLNWSLTGLYTYGKEKKIVGLNQKSLDIQRDIFLFNTHLTMQQERSEIAKMQALISTDNEIISLRENIKNTSKNQLEFGTATTNDYLTAVNAQDQAQQNLILHQLQLLLAQYNAQTTSGN